MLLTGCVGISDIDGMDVPTLIQQSGGRDKFRAALGVARTTILDWERLNRIPAGRVAQISEAFGLPVEDVIKLASGPRAVSEEAA